MHPSGEEHGFLRSIDRHRADPFGILEGRGTRYVQCLAQGLRFIVEWREDYDYPPMGEKFDHWRAQDRARLASLDMPYHPDIAPDQGPDLLCYSDTLRIFEAFLLEEPRPEKYHWMNIAPFLE